MLITDEQIKAIVHKHIIEGCKYRTDYIMVEEAIRDALRVEADLQRHKKIKA